MDPLPEWALREAPQDDEILGTDALERRLDGWFEPGWFEPGFGLAGDLMLGGRSFEVLEREGPDYAFRALSPLLRRSPIVMANLESPISRKGTRRARRFSYRMRPRMAKTIAEAGVSILHLANNHIMDCGPEGVLETIQIARESGLQTIGAGVNEVEAHRPVVCSAGGNRLGFLGYYWHPRSAAGPSLPGVAMNRPERLASDIGALRERVERIVVTFHWGTPYDRVPSEEIRARAHHAIDCGADLVAGHHPHVIQPLEIYRGRPIFYSLGNFAFGTGNSKAEGLFLSVGFQEDSVACVAIPLYVRNRDPRVNFQPKVLSGASGERMIRNLVHPEFQGGERLEIRDGWGFVSLPNGR